MVEIRGPLIQQEWEMPPTEREDMPLITTLGLIEGEVLTFLEEHGATALRGLIRELEWPARMIMMAVGALVREHLVRATQRELEVIIEPIQVPAKPWLDQEQVPEVWGG